VRGSREALFSSRRGGGPSSTAVEKQGDDVLRPRVKLGWRQGRAQAHGTPLRVSNNHDQKLLRREGTGLDGEARIAILSGEQVAN